MTVNGIPTRKLSSPGQFRAAVQADTQALGDRFQAVLQRDPSVAALANFLSKQQQFASLNSKVVTYTASPAEYAQSAGLKQEVDLASQERVASDSVRYHEQNNEVTVTWQSSKIPSVRYTISREVDRTTADLPAGQIAWSGPLTLSAVAHGGREVMVHIKVRPDTDRPYLDQSLQAERGVGSNHVMMDGLLRSYCSSPDRSTPANLARLSAESQALTGAILADLGLAWNLTD